MKFSTEHNFCMSIHCVKIYTSILYVSRTHAGADDTRKQANRGIPPHHYGSKFQLGMIDIVSQKYSQLACGEYNVIVGVLCLYVGAVWSVESPN